MPAMTEPAPTRDALLAGNRIIELLIVLLSAFQIALYLGIALQTLAYPYPLEWMEGGSMDVVERVRRGFPIYTGPTASYVPYIYAPMFFVVTALVTRVTGVDFFGARLVSFLSICGVLWLIACFIRREGGGRVASIAGVGLFLSTYEASGRWFHLARVDSLFLVLLLAGFYAIRFGKGWRAALLAAVLLWLSFLTKQTALVVAAVALPIAAVAVPRRAIGIAAVLGVLVLAINLIMDVRTGGWWRYFMYTLPLRHPVDFTLADQFWRVDMARNVPLALLGAALLAIARDRSRSIFYAALVVGMLASSFTTRIHTGGWLNDLMPAFAALAIAMPLGVEAAARTRLMRLAGSIALAAQLALPLVFPPGEPRPAVPSEADRAAGERFVAFLRGVDGEVMIWNQRFVETRAGKKSWGLEMAATDILRSSDATAKAALQADIIARVRTKQVAGVVDPPSWLLQSVHVGRPIELFDNRDVFVPVTGRPERPTRYYPVIQP